MWHLGRTRKSFQRRSLQDLARAWYPSWVSRAFPGKKNGSVVITDLLGNQKVADETKEKYSLE